MPTRGGSNDAALPNIATDDLTSGTYSGQRAQAIKLLIGAHGAGEDVDATTNPFPVTLATALDSSKDSVTAVGNVASGAADSGAPVKGGGVYNTVQPSGSTGQRLDAQMTSRGEYGAQLVGIQVAVVDGQSNTILTGTGQGGLGGTGGRPFFVSNAIFNNTTWDRQRGNVDGTALASAARTITTNSSDIVNYNGRGVDVILDMTVAGTGSVTLTIQGKDVLSGQYYTILAGVAVTSISTNIYRVYPGLVAAANAVANFIVPRTWRVNCVANNANSTTYSVGYSLVL